ncbi:aldolase [Aureimonas flava]|uniref:Aldolase n=1 Tax=Aureimonas flava TaxID=2320271 RepID=A0A3A1WI58_9HYPH|nr:aldolase/citrate lyase family protein [Aureimonas flava]RIX99719.1 aldolase [Aureimonas flava]
MLKDMREGRLSLGLGLHHLRTAAAPLLARATDHDWLFIDAEHGAFGQDDLAQMCLASLMTGVTPVVRVCRTALDQGVRALDNGAQGIVIPHVDTLADARLVAETFRYPPVGHRSWGGPPALFGYQAGPLGEAQRAANREILVVCMIESEAGVAAAGEIAAVGGVDALMVGTSDLSTEMGIPGQIGHQRVRDAVATVAEACERAGKIMGVGVVPDHDLAAEYIARGARFIVAGTDHSYLASAATARAALLRGAAPARNG